ncbi:hypothetical protein Taro_011204 [Colocasia esculenta]|uniref:DUF7733 domain-containing protein n=1 Tax=Colocasia esculenta TaxID=4460 RepID=A0A843U5G0_COLES|nr:hypothetical protein [Colocasia esculenta]
MSGGVGDVRQPKEEDPAAHRHRFLSFRHLNVLAVATVLSATGMVPLADLAFFAFSLAYVPLLARFAFPAAATAPEPPVFSGRETRALGRYVLLGAAVGLLGPTAYILAGVLGFGSREGSAAAAPHLFLLSCQVFMEGVTFAGHFSLPVRAFVPVFYNSKRMFTIADWLRAEMEAAAAEGEEQEGLTTWRRRLLLHPGRWLAMANLVFWAFNLFCFLLPVYVPRVFKRYYGQKLNTS